ncbi:hypothetical protein ACLOJK_037806 [Asimina triloba]
MFALTRIAIVEDEIKKLKASKAPSTSRSSLTAELLYNGLFLSITKDDLDNDAAVKESKPEEEVEVLLAEMVVGDGGINPFQSMIGL